MNKKNVGCFSHSEVSVMGRFMSYCFLASLKDNF